MSRARQRADRIREEIDITRVLEDYGYQVHAGYVGEQQYSCDLHGDGTDGKPSARVYSESNSTYCFACDRSRDAIQTVREKEGVGFWDAIRILEKRYGLSHMEYEDEGEDRRRNPSKGVVAEIDKKLMESNTTWDVEQQRTYSFLNGMTVDKDIPLRKLLRLWEAHDKVSFLVHKNLLPEDKAKAAIIKVRDAAMEQLRLSLAGGGDE